MMILILAMAKARDPYSKFVVTFFKKETAVPYTSLL
jgi:hypothetical protein